MGDSISIREATGLRRKTVELGYTHPFGGKTELKQPAIFDTRIKGPQTDALDAGKVVEGANQLFKDAEKVGNNRVGIRHEADGENYGDKVDLEKADLNGDGEISPEEWAGERFAASSLMADPKAGLMVLQDKMTQKSIDQYERREKNQPELNKQLREMGARAYRDSITKIKDEAADNDMTVSQKRQLLNSSKKTIEYTPVNNERSYRLDLKDNFFKNSQ